MLKQSLQVAAFLASTGKSHALAHAARVLHGLPLRGWLTDETLMSVHGDLPLRDERDYSLREFIEALYIIDHNGIYKSRLVEKKVSV